jgi:hypothetical protein
MKKLHIYEVGGVKMKKNEKKTCFVIWRNVFSLLFFLATLLALHFKDDLFRAWEGAPITF